MERKWGKNIHTLRKTRIQLILRSEKIISILKNKLSKEETSFIVKKIAICNDLWTQPQNVQLEAIQQLKKIQMQ